MEEKKLVHGCGPVDSKLWIVGEAPGEEEEASGIPFVGYSGKLLRDILQRCGVNPEKIRYENLSGIRPPKNNFGWFEDDPDRLQTLLTSVSELKARISECKPNLILCVGSKPLKYLMGITGSISDWRGHILWDDGLGTKVMASFHPSAALRQRNVDYDDKPGQYEALLSADVQKALDESQSAGLVRPDYHLITSPSIGEVRAEVDWILKNSKLIGYDIESIGGVIDCISFAGCKERAISIPLWVSTEDGLRNYWKSPEDQVEALRLICLVLQSEIPKIAQNSQFDCLMIREYWKTEVKNLYWDTMVMQHELYCDLPKDLGTLISLYTRLPYMKYLRKSSDLKDHWEYNAMDALALLHIYEGQVAEAKSLGYGLDHYLSISHPAILPLNEMQRIGVRVDEKLRSASAERELQVKQMILEALDFIMPVAINSDQKKFPHKFNPGSWKQKQDLFYGLFGCRKIYNKGSVSTDEEALLKIIVRDPRMYVRLIAEACIKYSKASNMYSKLSTPTRNGRMHTAYGITGTVTGRLNSSEGILGGTNLQNLKKGIQRQQFIPDEGYEFSNVDQWAAESYLVAIDAKEVAQVEMLNRGEKPYQWLLKATVEKFPQAVKDALYEYKDSKQGIHGMNYGAEPDIISFETRLALDVCRWQYALYHGTFPGIKMRMRRVEENLKRTRKTVSLLGRTRLWLAPIRQELFKKAYAWSSQSCIGELTLIALNKLYWYGRTGRNQILSGKTQTYPDVMPLLNTHDGLVTQFKIGEREEMRRVTINAFNIPLEQYGIGLLIPIEIAYGKNFNDFEDEEVIRYT